MRKAFVDTNVIIYANDTRDRRKREIALDLLERLIADGNGVISTQVCMEYASVASTKLGQKPDAVSCQLAALESLEVVPVSVSIIQMGLVLMRAHDISFWDAVIVAAAETARCDELFTEDLNDGQRYGVVRAVNPFTA